MAALRFRFTVILLTASLLAACQSPAVRPLPPPGPEMIGAGALQLPASCKPSGSVVVDFTVLENGQTSDIRPVDADPCVNEALTAWVASFRYTPAVQQTRTSVEWLLVEAKKGS